MLKVFESEEEIIKKKSRDYQRRKRLTDKFGEMTPKQFIDYTEENPECPRAHEYITSLANYEQMQAILKLADQKRPFRVHSTSLKIYSEPKRRK